MSALRAVVLAAGKGTRMKSNVPKVFHELCGRPMLWWVLRALREAQIEEIVVVISPEMHEQFATSFDAAAVVQQEQLGTGHAVRVALEALPPRNGGNVLITNADMPLVTAETFHAVIEALGNDVMSLVTVSCGSALPSFGRVVRKGACVERIVEVRDATPDELNIEEKNAGIYVADEAKLRTALTRLTNDNAQHEYYLTDVVELLSKADERINATPLASMLDLLGVNDRVQLANARTFMSHRLCEQHMRDGVTIIDPASTYLEPELSIGRDTVIYPNTSIGRLSEIGEGCTIGPNVRLSNAKIGNRSEVRESVILDSTIGERASVGPFAHLRGESVLADEVRIGNFVEMKNARLARAAKAAHLSYLGDVSVGEEANIGAGTITCNFDGKQKHRTKIGKRAMIGSNTSLVAPVEIGDDALTGAGSVVTKDVPDGERVAGNPARPLPKRPS